MVTLRGAWTWGRERGLVQGACPHCATSTRQTRPRHTPSPGEAAELIGRLMGWARLAALLVATTGARRGEVAHLSTDRLRLTDEGGEVLLWEKGRSSRWVPLLPEVAAELRRWLADREAGRRVDPRPDIVLGVAPGTVTAGLRARLAEATGEGETRSTPHSLRRLASTGLIQAGVDPATYQAVMGHSYALGLSSYAHAGEESRRSAVEALRLPRGMSWPSLAQPQAHPETSQVEPACNHFNP